MTDTATCIGGPLDGQQHPCYGFTSFGADFGDGLGWESYSYERVEFQGMQFFVADAMGYLAARREMRRLYAESQSAHLLKSIGIGAPDYASAEALRRVANRAQHLVEVAQWFGVVLTITQRPLQPLGMAHYETVVEVRPVQVPT